MMVLRASELIIVLLLLFVHCISTHWWLSSQVFTVGSRGGCSNIAGLVKEQKTLCKQYPSLMEVVGLGAKLGLLECQHQFRTSKWNCSHENQRRKGLLGLLTSKGNKEAAFFQAITSAGVVSEVSRACNEDKHHQSCSCDYRNPGRTTLNGVDFKWSGCNDNIKFGVQFAQEFFEAREIGNDARVLMNKQNNLAGRMAVKRNMWLDCTCHGVSGACNLRTCRYSLPDFYAVGDFLQKKYHSAVYVTLDQSKNILVPRIIGVKPPTKTDLVYLEESPDYCVENVREGTLGVNGRICNRTSDGQDGCGVMCCGMGFHSKKVWVEESCNCEFKWCCKVKCDKCRIERIQTFCRAKKRRRHNRYRSYESPFSDV